MPNYVFIIVLNRMVGPTPFQLKLEDLLVEGIRFILNGLDYRGVGPDRILAACYREGLSYLQTTRIQTKRT